MNNKFLIRSSALFLSVLILLFIISFANAAMLIGSNTNPGVCCTIYTGCGSYKVLTSKSTCDGIGAFGSPTMYVCGYSLCAQNANGDMVGIYGSSGTAFSVPSNPTCNDQCDNGCSSGQQQCVINGFDYCVNTQSDTYNCGSCGHTCQSGTYCNAGSCVNYPIQLLSNGHACSSSGQCADFCAPPFSQSIFSYSDNGGYCATNGQCAGTGDGSTATLYNIGKKVCSNDKSFYGTCNDGEWDYTACDISQECVNGACQQKSTCGNGIVESYEQCDPSVNGASVCNSDCTWSCAHYGTVSSYQSVGGVSPPSVSVVKNNGCTIGTCVNGHMTVYDGTNNAIVTKPTTLCDPAGTGNNNGNCNCAGTCNLNAGKSEGACNSYDTTPDNSYCTGTCNSFGVSTPKACTKTCSFNAKSLPANDYGFTNGESFGAPPVSESFQLYGGTNPNIDCCSYNPTEQINTTIIRGVTYTFCQECYSYSTHYACSASAPICAGVCYASPRTYGVVLSGTYYGCGVKDGVCPDDFSNGGQCGTTGQGICSHNNIRDPDCYASCPPSTTGTANAGCQNPSAPAPNYFFSESSSGSYYNNPASYYCASGACYFCNAGYKTVSPFNACQTVCGDNIAAGTEACDNGLQGDSKTFSGLPATTCNAQSFCTSNGYSTVSSYGNGPPSCPGNTYSYNSITCSNPINYNGKVCTASYGNSCTYCSAACQNVTAMTGGSCGDNVTNGPEVCDNGPSSATKTASCTTASGYSGTKSCSNGCLGYGLCTTTQSCGDGAVNGPEQCDGGSAGASQLFSSPKHSGVDVCGDTASRLQFCQDNHYTNFNPSSLVTYNDNGGPCFKYSNGWTSAGGSYGPITCVTPANTNTPCTPNSGSCTYCASSNCQVNTVTCTITGVIVTPDTCSGNVCGEGDKLNITITYSGSCSAANFAQVDLKSIDGSCTIQASGGSMVGLNGPVALNLGVTKFQYTLASVPSACAGSFISNVNGAALRIGSPSGAVVSNFYQPAVNPAGQIILDQCTTPARNNFVNYARFQYYYASPKVFSNRVCDDGSSYIEFCEEQLGSRYAGYITNYSQPATSICSHYNNAGGWNNPSMWSTVTPPGTVYGVTCLESPQYNIFNSSGCAAGVCSNHVYTSANLVAPATVQTVTSPLVSGTPVCNDAVSMDRYCVDNGYYGGTAVSTSGTLITANAIDIPNPCEAFIGGVWKITSGSSGGISCYSAPGVSVGSNNYVCSSTPDGICPDDYTSTCSVGSICGYNADGSSKDADCANRYMNCAQYINEAGSTTGPICTPPLISHKDCPANSCTYTDTSGILNCLANGAIAQTMYNSTTMVNITCFANDTVSVPYTTLCPTGYTYAFILGKCQYSLFGECDSSCPAVVSARPGTTDGTNSAFLNTPGCTQKANDKITQYCALTTSVPGDKRYTYTGVKIK